MNPKKILALAATVALFWVPGAQSQTQPESNSPRGAHPDSRSAYSYVREVDGQVTVVSEANGSVEARRNLPISAGDSLSTEDPARAEIALADGNVAPGRRRHAGQVRVALRPAGLGRRGLGDRSLGGLRDPLGRRRRGSARSRASTPTTLSVYANQGSRVRVNADPRHGSAVIVRAGSVEVRSRTGSYTVRAGNYLTVQRRGGARDRARRVLARPLRRLGGGPARVLLRVDPQRLEQVRRRGLRRRRPVARRLRELATRRRIRRRRLAAQRRRELVALLERQLVLHAGRPELVVLGSVGLVSVPLRQLVLERRLEQLVLVSRLRLLARVVLLRLLRRLLRLVPHRLVRRLLALVEQLLQELGLPARRRPVRDQRALLDAQRGAPRLELHEHQQRRQPRTAGRRERHAGRGPARDPTSRSPRARSWSRRATGTCGTQCASRSARRRARSNGRRVETPNASRRSSRARRGCRPRASTR